MSELFCVNDSKGLHGEKAYEAAKAIIPHLFANTGNRPCFAFRASLNLVRCKNHVQIAFVG